MRIYDGAPRSAGRQNPSGIRQLEQGLPAGESVSIWAELARSGLKDQDHAAGPTGEPEGQHKKVRL